MGSRIEIRLLGGFDFNYEGRRIPALGAERSMMLMAWLLLHRDTPQHRRHVAFRLWPDSPEPQARASLRQALHQLRTALPTMGPGLAVDARTVTWQSSGQTSLDVDEFEASIAEAAGAGPNRRRLKLKQALEWYRGPLLPECYHDWLEPHRDRLHRLYLDTLQALARLAEDERDYPEAIDLLTRLRDADPLRESAHRDLIRLHALAGDRNRALEAWQHCETVLARELGTSPTERTRAVFERVRDHAVEVRATGDGRPVRPATDLPLVGRVREWSRLMQAWRRAIEGRAEVVFIDGEPGAGKTRLAGELLRRAGVDGARTAHAGCHAAEGSLAFAAVSQWLRSPDLRGPLTGLAPLWLGEVSRILPELRETDPALPAPDPRPQRWQRPQFFEALARAVSIPDKPMALAIDDVQWSDSGTLEWLHYLVRTRADMPVLIVATVRDDGTTTPAALQRLRLELLQSGQGSEITVGQLSREETAALVHALTGRPPSRRAASALHRDTDGNPLFIVETVRSRADTGGTKNARRRNGEPAQMGPNLPARMEAVLRGRLARLSPVARDAAMAGAVTGEAFTLELLALALDHDEPSLVPATEELVRRRVLQEHGDGRLEFTHQRLRETALRMAGHTRRRFLHRRLASALETLHAGNLDPMSARIAAHRRAGGAGAATVPHLWRAAVVARAMFAFEDALDYLARAVSMIDATPRTHEHRQLELPLLLALAPASASVRGYAAEETGQRYMRAHRLCRKLRRSGEHGPVLWGLWTYHVVRGDLRRARSMSLRLLELAGETGHGELHARGHLCLGASLFHLGRADEAHRELSVAISFCEAEDDVPDPHAFEPDVEVFSHSYASHARWLAGQPGQAMSAVRAALARARVRDHPFSLALALDYAGILHQLRNEPAAVQRYADAAFELCTEHGFHYYQAWASILQGWARTRMDPHADGPERMREGLAGLAGTGAALRRPYYLGLLADAWLHAGQPRRARAAIDAAIEQAAANRERWFEPELYRLKAGLHARSRRHREQADALLSRALSLATRQGAHALALRAALDRVELHRDGAKERRALRHLHRVMDRFDGSTGTAELARAESLRRSIRGAAAAPGGRLQ